MAQPKFDDGKFFHDIPAFDILDEGKIVENEVPEEDED